MMPSRIPCLLMRGGTSKAAYFLADDLPAECELRDRVLLAAMGSPDPRQIDGLGGADSLTSKVGIIRKSSRPGIDVDYLFAQVVVNEPRVDYGQNCGNILAGVGPFAVERGLVTAQGEKTSIRIYMENTGQTATAIVETPKARCATPAMSASTVCQALPRPSSSNSRILPAPLAGLCCRLEVRLTTSTALK